MDWPLLTELYFDYINLRERQLPMSLQKKGLDTRSAAAELRHGRSPSEIISQKRFLRKWSHFLRKPFSEKMTFLKFHFLRKFQKTRYRSHILGSIRHTSFWGSDTDWKSLHRFTKFSLACPPMYLRYSPG